MGKKAASETISSKRKQKHKQMFPELATHQEQRMQDEAQQRPTQARRVIAEDSEQDVELEVLEHQNRDLDAICDVVSKLLAKNKVSAKNAFEVPLIDIEKLPDFKGNVENQYAWKRLSSTLESDYKIYGYRVDAIHSITYSILNTIARRQQDNDSVQVPPKEQEIQQPLRMQEPLEGQYLERKISNLNFVELELVTRMDPILERTKRQFDMLGQQSMMLNTLAIDEVLALQLVKRQEGSIKYPPWGQYQGEWTVEDPLMAFFALSDFRSKLRQKVQGLMIDQAMEGIWPQQMDYEFLQDKQNCFTGNQPGQPLGNKKKAISDEINFKYPFYRNDGDIAQDAQNWMGEMDRKFLGISKKTGRQDASVKIEVKQEDPMEFIDFDIGEKQDIRDDVFRPEQDKMEHHQDIEDRFLLAGRLLVPFQLKDNMVWLRQQELIEVEVEGGGGMGQQVDIRRQNVSIMEAKRRMKEHLHNRSTFKSVCGSYGEDEMSPALCFLTILHLANECDLTLQSIDETNFYVS